MTQETKSPFHAGERRLQSLLGVREQMERFGRMVIRDHMPDQHRDFYAQLPFVFIGHADARGWPWASILHGEPGFLDSADAGSLEVRALPLQGDPLGESLLEGMPVGILGIELHTRRRNRMSGHVSRTGTDGFSIRVDQAFGNCPQYIQCRHLERVDPPQQAIPRVRAFRRLDEPAREMIRRSDTFFVASCVAGGRGVASEGVDVSHRGGRPGFIRIDDGDTLVIPDYPGNHHFNTLGNFLENPRAGLLFIDFENGRLLTLTGTVEVSLDGDGAEYFPGAERHWSFRLDHGRWLENVLPMRWRFDSYSPNTLLTGTWDQEAAVRAAELHRNRWFSCTVSRVVEESSVIKSFQLVPESGVRFRYHAGQFITLRANIEGREVIRTYSLSSAPAEGELRISVKRQESAGGDKPRGLFSGYLHDDVVPGTRLEMRAPAGGFVLDTTVERPVLLLAAGVGITPMVSMLWHSLYEAVRTRTMRPVLLVAAARDARQRAFFQELREVERQSAGMIRVFWVLSQVEDGMVPGRGYHHAGRIDGPTLQALLPHDDCEVYLCGPASFMQAMYGEVRRLGIADERIHAEHFGPAALVRDGSGMHEQSAPATEAMVEFRFSRVEQPWTAEDGSLLEFAEAHGLYPEYGCRNGRCGACKVKLLSGRVSHRPGTGVELEEGEALLCCAVPAEHEGMARLVLPL